MRRKGFTLIEVLVALVVTVAALTVVCQGFATGARASVAAQKTTRAALLAQRVLTDVETGVIPLGQSSAGTFEDEPEFLYETRSEPDLPGLTLLAVTVKWDERGQPRAYVLTRLMRERTTTP